jgi:DNA repair protein RadA/Sms
LKEAAKLGFSTAVVPRETRVDAAGLALRPIKDVGDLLALAGAGPARAAARSARIES